MREIKVLSDNKHLCEIYNTGFQLAFVSEDDKQTHQWVLCKDFMTDVIWGTIHKRSISIYGFEYNPETHPSIALDPVKIIVRNKTLEGNVFDKQIKQSHKFLRLVEKRLKFKASKIEKVKFGTKNQSVWMFTLDKKWIHASPLFSMLSLFLRVGCNYKNGDNLNDAFRGFKQISHNDARYLKSTRDIRHLIFKRGLSIFQAQMKDNYPMADIHTIHNNSGIVGAKKCTTFTKLWDLTGIETVVTKKKKEQKK